MKSIILQSQFTGYRPKKDKSCALTFASDLEVSSEDIKTFHELLDQRGIIYFSVKGELTQAEIDEIDNVDLELEGKTKSQRLRSVMYIELKQFLKRKPTQEEFSKYYSDEMEREIQKRKDNLKDE